jgi:hypothetical protein
MEKNVVEFLKPFLLKNNLVHETSKNKNLIFLRIQYKFSENIDKIINDLYYQLINHFEEYKHSKIYLKKNPGFAWYIQIQIK